MSTLAADVALLGGAHVLRTKVTSRADLIALLRAGLPYASLEATRKVLGLTREQIAASLAIPRRTLARRQKELRLRPGESDRLYRLARIAAGTLAVLGEADKARRWLRKPNRALGGDAPLAFMDTDLGTREVEEILGRIEHGVVS